MKIYDISHGFFNDPTKTDKQDKYMHERAESVSRL